MNIKIKNDKFIYLFNGILILSYDYQYLEIVIITNIWKKIRSSVKFVSLINLQP